MAGSINLGTIPDPAGGQCAFTLDYDDQNRATSFNGVNNSANAVQARIVGLAADGTEDVANKTFALLLQPGQADHVSIPITGVKAIQLAVNARGKIAGFDTYLG